MTVDQPLGHRSEVIRPLCVVSLSHTCPDGYLRGGEGLFYYGVERTYFFLFFFLSGPVFNENVWRCVDGRIVT